MENSQQFNRTEEILSHLTDWDARHRHQAREQLVQMGTVILPLLLEKLSSKNWHVRWEAAKALGEIGDPLAAGELVRLLQDNDTSVRWAAMSSLIRLGRSSVEPMLTALTNDFHSARLRHGTHHILRVLHGKGLLTQVEKEVFHALEGAAPDIEAAQAANRALIAEFF